MTNAELWKAAENGEFSKGQVFKDQDGNEIIFTGNAFQVYYTEENEEEKYVGLCVGDNWKYTGKKVYTPTFK